LPLNKSLVWLSGLKLENACGYLKVAELMGAQHLLHVAQVNVAIGIRQPVDTNGLNELVEVDPGG
jgi:hypothetical protein